MSVKGEATTVSTSPAATDNTGNAADDGFRRDMGFWGNLALGFTYLSPVVAVYTTLAIGLGLAGPPAFWVVMLAAVGQLFVAMVFGEVVSQYPIAGGIYPWNRRLWGPKWGWFSGWVYAFAICATIASVAYGAGPFLGLVVNPDPATEMSNTIIVLLAIGIVLFATLINFLGTKVLSQVAFWGFVAEIIATLVIGIWLLIQGREHDLGVLFQDLRPAELMNEQSFVAALAGAALTGIFLFYGFEACGDVAEEVKNPGVVVPRAMRMTIYVGGVAAAFIALGLILSVPDYQAVMNGTATDPVGETFQRVFGPVGFKILMAIVLISFISCVISLQAAASRLLFSMGRDNQLPGSALLRKFNHKRHVPPFAMLAAAAFPIVVVLISTFSPDALTAVISFCSFGIYFAFGMVTVASIRARLKGWRPAGKYSMGAWGWLVSVLALIWQLFGLYIVLRPDLSDPEAHWTSQWLVALSGVAVFAVGLIYMVVAKPYRHATGPAGDAISGSAPAAGGDASA
ncbi:APC family permease [Leucobacter sp. OH1287]|uniref:APC family permease n=1 Tax=Leucobacter sp. OH1287 TaxID=2491049 RepID=UPI000F5EB048|nr:APC family permease [Leucobacter sp. OH1287]RRD61516.1 amino acid permease [Leucobacter sp. OH1287]